MPRGHALNPTEEAVAWADSEAEQVPVEAWPVLGVPGTSADTSLVSQLAPLLLQRCHYPVFPLIQIAALLYGIR